MGVGAPYPQPPAVHPIVAAAIGAAREPGEIALRYNHGGKQVTNKPDQTPETQEDREAETAITPRLRRAYLGRWMEVPVHEMDGLPPGQEIKGPAIFESATTTVVIRADERALVTAQGWLDSAIG